MDYQKRLNKLQDLLRESQIDLLLVENPIDLYYLTGQELSRGTLCVKQQSALLFVDGRYFEKCKKNCPTPVALSKETFLQELLQESEIKTISFDEETTSYKQYLELTRKIDSVTSRSFSLIPSQNIVKEMRAIKDSEELNILREAAAIGSLAYSFVIDNLKEGISEIELATELEFYLRKKGARKMAFDPIIAFGTNSAYPHYRANDAKLKKRDLVLVDIGIDFKHYQSDMTRVLFFGNPDPKLMSIYTIVKEAQQQALTVCKPGITIGELDQAARNHIKSAGLNEFFTHSLGHGIGLEIHESPTIRDALPFRNLKLLPGMVITIEPGIYLPGVGGIRIEDSVIITENGHENLSSPSKEITII